MEKELNVSLYEFMGVDRLSGRTSDDGSPSAESFRKYILENWDKYERVSILFDSVVEMTRPFLDEAFSKLLEEHSLEDFNRKIFFPDAREDIVKSLNDAFKIRMKIIKSKRDKEADEFGL